MVPMLRGYALAYFAILSSAFAWGVDSSSPASKRRPRVLWLHLEFVVSALEGKISLGCDWATWQAYVTGFVSLMVQCTPAWVLEVDVEVIKRLSKSLRQWNEQDLALALLCAGGLGTMGTATELIKRITEAESKLEDHGVDVVGTNDSTSSVQFRLEEEDDDYRALRSVLPASNQCSGKEEVLLEGMPPEYYDDEWQARQREKTKELRRMQREEEEEEERKIEEYREIGLRLKEFPEEDLRKARKLVSSFITAAEEVEERIEEAAEKGELDELVLMIIWNRL
ncbi:unnamed protein product [Brassica napus]|nr:unnamed protein product [Brassica napus]